MAVGVQQKKSHAPYWQKMNHIPITGGITILAQYIKVAMSKARYELLPDDGTFYGEIAGFDGVYANAATFEACQNELEEVLEEWIVLYTSRHFPLPFIINNSQG